MNIGDIIYKQRKALHMRQKDAANRLHVSKSTFCNYENNVHEPPLATLVSLADLFNVSTDYLLGRTTLNSEFSVLNETIDGELTYSNLIQTIKKWDKEERLYFARTFQMVKKHAEGKP